MTTGPDGREDAAADEHLRRSVTIFVEILPESPAGLSCGQETVVQVVVEVLPIILRRKPGCRGALSVSVVGGRWKRQLELNCKLWERKLDLGIACTGGSCCG